MATKKKVTTKKVDKVRFREYDGMERYHFVDNDGCIIFSDDNLERLKDLIDGYICEVIPVMKVTKNTTYVKV